MGTSIVGAVISSLVFIALLTCLATAGCGPNTEDFVRVRSSRIALRHVSVVDGTGSPAKDNQTVVIDQGRIAAAGPAGETLVPPDAQTLDLQKDIDIKREIDEGREVGPKIHLSSPYLHASPDIATLVRLIDTVADAGVTSLKEIVFKDGVGFDSAALMRAEHGKIGLTNWRLWLFAGIFTVLLLLLYGHARLTGSRSSRR